MYNAVSVIFGKHRAIIRNLRVLKQPVRLIDNKFGNFNKNEPKVI